jgi:hypothetical protein
MSVPVCGGAWSGCLDAEAELAGNSGKSDAAGQTSASSRGPKLAVGTFFLSCRYAWPGLLGDGALRRRDVVS